MSRNKYEYRLVGDLPKVGVRPAIDGRRRGVREALETQTMKMAKNLAKYITNNINYPNGQPVECIIADSCIGGLAEATKADEKFRRENVGLTITVTP